MGFMVPNLHSYSSYTGSCMLQHREIVRDCLLGFGILEEGSLTFHFQRNMTAINVLRTGNYDRKGRNIVDSSYFMHPNEIEIPSPSSKSKESYEHHPNKILGPTEYHINPPEFALGQHLNRWCHISHPLQLELISQARRAPLNLD